MFDTRSVDLRKLNSLTKYPSIPTYHLLGQKGLLTNDVVPLRDVELVVTEKVDGTNGRILLMPDNCYIIGSREELLWAKGDLIVNPMLGIADTLKEVAPRLTKVAQRLQDFLGQQAITPFYLEVYGGNISKASKQYTSDRSLGFRLFDINTVTIDKLDHELESYSGWRERGGQPFVHEATLAEATVAPWIGLTPRIHIRAPLPTSIEGTYEWLRSHIQKTQVALDDKAGGKPEGLVVRSYDRSKIVKLRLEDYERHLRKTGKL